jgi:hypothetical protein
MTQFEQYRWEDRVLRKGSWKVNLAVGAAAFGVLTVACLDPRGSPWAGPSVSPQSNGTTVAEIGLPQREAPPEMRGAIPEHLDGAIVTSSWTGPLSPLRCKECWSNLTGGVGFSSIPIHADDS